MANNNLTALSPEFWVAEGLRILRERLVIYPNISFDYSPAVARQGQVVSVHKKSELYASRKLPGVDVTTSNLEATETLVKLDQQPHVHYSVEDIEQATSMGDVVNDWIEPAFYAIARYIEEITAMQAYDFFRNQAGGDLVNSVSYSDLVDANRVMNVLKVPVGERPLIVNHMAESALLKENNLTRVDAIGDGSRILNGQIGSGAGFRIAASPIMPMQLNDVNKVKVTGAVNNTGGYPTGATTLTVDGITGLITVGTFCKIYADNTQASDMGVHQVTAQSASGGNTIGITIVPGLIRPVTDNAVIVFYTPGTVSGNYAEGYKGLVTVTPASGTVPDKYGAISFAANGAVYGILSVTNAGGGDYELELNRPLEAAISNGGLAANFPPVGVNWSMTRDAVTMVNRPLSLPKGNVQAALGDAMGIAVRVVIGYDMKAQEELVTVDTLCGIKTLDRNKGMLLIG